MYADIINNTINNTIKNKLAGIEPSQETLAYIFGEMAQFGELLAQTIAALPLRLLLVDGEGRIVAATGKALKEVFVCERADILGKFFSNALPGGSIGLDRIMEIDDAISDALAWEGDVVWPGSGKTWQLQVLPVILADGTHRNSLLLFTPQERDWFARGERSDRLAHMGQVSSGLLHEIKNSLQNVTGIVQIMQFKYMNNDAMQGQLNIITEELTSVYNMLTGFLGLSRLDMNVMDYSLNDAVRDALLLVYGNCHIRRIEMTEQLDESLPPIYMDKGRIKQVIINCLENSMESILEKRQSQPDFVGRINIRTECDQPQQLARLIFEDDGIGLDEEQTANFFKPFFTTKQDGTGMGTSISQAIMRIHGGSMEALGRPGEGCRVTITLPFYSALAADKQDMLDIFGSIGE